MRVLFCWIIALIVVLAPGYSWSGEIISKFSQCSNPFIANLGQVDGRVAFYTHLINGTAFVTVEGKIVYSLDKMSLNEELVGSNLAEIVACDRQQTKVSNFHGSTGIGWFGDIPVYGVLDLGEVYCGIELRLKAYLSNVEKLFIVKPGASPESIKLRIQGCRYLAIDSLGQLEVVTEAGSVNFTRPIAYQKIDGLKKFVEVSYSTIGREYGFAVGDYNPNYPLIIDPLLASTYLGGSGPEGGSDSTAVNAWVNAARDGDGNVFVTGLTLSLDFPTTPGVLDDDHNGNLDIFVVKFNEDLTTLLASTYLGGSADEQLYTRNTITVDTEGNIFVSGTTESSNFPRTPGAYREVKSGGADVFISKLSGDLTTLMASTFIGGSNSDVRGKIALDASGNVFVTGTTFSTDFPYTSGVFDTVHNGDNDIFVSKLSSDLSTLLASTFLGGSYREDYPSMVIDGEGNIYLSGATASDDYPTTTGAYDESFNGPYTHGEWDLDACITKLDNNLSTLLASTFVGGDEYESALHIVRDGDGNIYIAGHTWDANYPVGPGVIDDEFSGDEYFISKLDADLSTLLASTFTTPGNTGLGNIWHIVHDGQGYLYTVGITTSDNYPVTGSAFDDAYNGGNGDAFLTKLDDDLTSIHYSTYLGGSGNDGAGTILIDGTDNATATVVGFTTSTDFPTSTGAYSEYYNGASDCFISKIPTTQFTRITEGPHVNDGGHSWSANWVDYDNDGYLDIFVSNIDIDNGLYHNNGDGTFAKITGEALTVNSSGIASAGVSWGDYNNDGYADVFIATYREGAPPVNNAFTNNGDGSFTQISGSAIVGDAGMSIEPAWVDYNNDGLLDLYVANHHDMSAGTEGNNFMYRQDGSGFIRITVGATVTNSSGSNCASWADYDNDGDQDLFVANGWVNPNDCLYENNGDGSFSKILSGSPTESPGVSWGGSWGDYDNDGFTDLFVTQSVWGSPTTSYDSLFHNNGDGTFTSPSGIAPNVNGGYSNGAAWGDFDNDGDLDLFVAVEGANLFYENGGDGSFVRITEGVIVTDNNSSTGCAAGDYDRDGDLDLFVTNIQENNVLYQNNGNSNNWINIKCEGTVSNRSAIGARVRIKAVVGGNPLWQMRDISSKTGKNGQNSLNAHFGLRDASVIDSIIVEWPSGMVDVMVEVDINQFLTITETICGDANNDEAVNIGDVVYLIKHIFNNGPAPLPLVAGDANCDGSVNIGDAVFLGNYVFQPGAPRPCALCQ